jgi:hypothetical protein
MMDLEIRPIETSKDKIKQPPLAEQGIIPRINTSCIFNGSSGQGKSTLLANLANPEGRFYPPDTWHVKILISPTAEGDDVQKALQIKDPFIVSNLKEAPKVLATIMKKQKSAIKEMGNHRAPQILLIYDDVVSHPEFTGSDEFIQSFIAARHYNFTTWLCGQSWTATPRRCRLQAQNVFFFPGSQSEQELLASEYCPPGLNKKECMKMIEFATSEPYSFLYINKSQPFPSRYRKKLSEIIVTTFFIEKKEKEADEQQQYNERSES